MKKKYVAYAALLAMSLLLFTGCDALISNAFKSANLGQPSAEKIKEMNTDDLIKAAGLSSGEVSDTFIETVLSDADTLQTVKDTLQVTIDNSAEDPEAAQQASVLLINIELAEDNIDDVVDDISKSIGNIFSQLSGNSKSKAATDIDYMALIKEMFPNKDTVAPLVNAIGDLHPLFVQLSALLDSNLLYLDHPTLAYLAQIALLSEAVYQIQQHYLGTGYTTVGDMAAALYEIVITNKQSLPDPLTSYYFNPTEPDMTKILASYDDNNNPTMLYTLFKKAGMEDVLTMLQDAVSNI